MDQLTQNHPQRAYQTYIVVSPLDGTKPVQSGLLSLNQSNGPYPVSFLYVPPAAGADASGFTAVVIGSTHEVDSIGFKEALDRKLQELIKQGIAVKSRSVDRSHFAVFPTQEELETRVRDAIASTLSE